MPPWTLVSAAAPLSLLKSRYFVAIPDGSLDVYAFAVEPIHIAGTVDTHTVRVTCGVLGSTEPVTSALEPDRLGLDDVMIRRAGATPDRVLIVPHVRWSGHPARFSFIPILLTAAVLAIVCVGAIIGWLAWWVVVPAAALAAWSVTASVRKHRSRSALPPTVVLHAPPSAVPGTEEPKAYSTAQIATRIDPSLAGSRASDSATARVDAVKAEYGQLRSDIAYRIDCSALFDGTVAPTRDFTLLLMKWDDDETRGTPAALDRLSREIRLAFDTARRNAEALGLGHLPRTARRKAERAVKAARLAVEGSTDGERSTALDQLGRLVSELDLHYLPDRAELPRMIGSARPALEPMA